MNKSLRLLVTVPVYGQIEFTHAVVRDLWREKADFMIIDNGNSYEALGDERVIRPGRNLGWAGGSNLGFRTAFSEGYEWAMTLNNDTRLSCGFFDGLLHASIPRDAGVVCPLYDDVLAHPALTPSYNGAAERYEPQPRYRVLRIADGTGLTLNREAWTAAGELDTRSFGRFGWGADIDLCIRVREAGFGIYASEMAFMNHLGKKTALDGGSIGSYHLRAGLSMRRGMRKIYGRDWRARINQGNVPIHSLDDGRLVDVNSY